MAHPNSESYRQSLIDKDPFYGMHISDSSFLNTLEGRYPCAKCGKSRKFFCYTCYIPITLLTEKLPRIKLPIKIDIIKHKHEIDGKSTAAHAAILASEDVTVYTYPDIPHYDKDEVVLIFPSYTAIEVSQLFSENVASFNDITKTFNVEFPKGFNRSTLMMKIPDVVNASNANTTSGCKERVKGLPIKRAIFIDSTWNQSRGIYKDDNIKELPCVVLQNRISQFWRHQKGSPRWYLATVEAIHQLLVEVHINAWGVNSDYKGLTTCFSENKIDNHKFSSSESAYNGQYDDLLFFFRHMYDLIHDYYDHDNLHAYKRRLM